MLTKGLLRGLALPLLLLVSALLLWPGVHGPFLFDDFPNLKNLGEVNGNPTWRNIGIYLSLFPGTPGRPLSALSFLLNDTNWPSTAYGFKVTNLLIHLLNGVLVFGLARTLSRTMAGTSRGLDDRHSDLAALLCAALWLLSPIQISAVFLTIQRMTELAATFAFAGIWAFIALLPRARTIPRGVLALAALGAGSVLSFLCKENGALVPLLACTACATILSPAMALLSAWPRRLVWAGMLLPSIAVLGYLASIALQAPEGNYQTRNFGLAERVMTEGRVLVDYITLIVLPRLSSTGLFNDDYTISRSLTDPLATAPSLTFIALALIAGLVMRRRAPLFSFGVLWFLGAHVMESSVIALEIYFEHRNYVPLFGPAFAVAAAASRLKGNLRRPLIIGVCAWLCLAAGITHLQARTWGDAGRMATYWQAEHPLSLRAQQFYAGYLLQHDRPREATAVLERAQRNQISPADSALQLLTLDCDAGIPGSPGEIATIGDMLETSHATPGTAMILARLRQSIQSGTCAATVSPGDWLHLTDKVMTNPNAGGIVRMLRVERAELFLAAGRLDEAIHELDLVYMGGYESRVAFYAAALLATAGRKDEALAWARKPLARPWNWKDWLSQTDRQANELIDAIENARQLRDDTPNR